MLLVNKAPYGALFFDRGCLFYYLSGKDFKSDIFSFDNVDKFWKLM